MLRRFAAMVIAGSFLISGTAFAATNANQGVLPQGKAAGVKQAELWEGHQLLWLFGAAGVLGVVYVATGNGHGTVANTCPLTGCSPPSTSTGTSH